MIETMAIQVKNLVKTYGKIQALKNVSFDIPHKTIGLLGPNGSGKTTFMKILMGLLKYNSGQILIEGEQLSKIAIRERFGYMPENDCQFPGLSGLLSVTYAGELAGIPYWDSLKRSDHILGYVGLGEAYHRPVGEYSTGMKQRIKLAQALIHDSPFLLLDEPTNGMDPKGRSFMLDLIRDLKKANKIIILSSHLLKDIEETCDYVVMLHRGECLLQSSIQELKAKQKQPYRIKLREEDVLDPWIESLKKQGLNPKKGDQLGEVWLPEEAPTRLLFETAQSHQVEIRQIQCVVQSLEDIFIQAVQNTTGVSR
ncbi:MAG: ABC transporter ATP-binding protein [Planctomycetota bacterium]